MWISNEWNDYELLDISDGERLERWGKYTLIRPDPQVILKNTRTHPLWKKADASYRRERTGGGHWNENRLPEQWTIDYRDLRFRIKPMGFKHTGLFPEQATNWDWFSDLIRRRVAAGRPVRVLNLFAYTGGATMAAAAAGASVCHVDAARGMVAAAKENAALSGLSERPIRYIVDDCKKFIERELRRGNRYDGIIMDPPSYGRGPTGEVWKIEESIDGFVTLASGLLSDDPLFFLLNSYTTGLSTGALRTVTDLRLPYPERRVSEALEIGLPVLEKGIVLPCGGSVRVTFS